MPGVVMGFVRGTFLHSLTPLSHFDPALGLCRQLDTVQALLGY